MQNCLTSLRRFMPNPRFTASAGALLLLLAGLAGTSLPLNAQIPPLTARYCGYVGGAEPENDVAMAVGPDGSLYIAGITATSPSGPVNSAFAAKIRADGSGLDYYAVIGSGVFVRTIAVDATGRLVVAGTVHPENDLPVSIGPDLTYNGGSTDAFVARLSASGSGIDFAGFIGGDGNDYAACLALDAAGNVYLGGATGSGPSTFPVRIGPALAMAPWSGAGFVARVRNDGSSLDYCGYVPGWHTSVYGIAVDAAGCAYLCGESTGGIPEIVGPDLTYNGEDTDGFVAKVKSDGSGFVFSGWIGGGDGDWETARAIAVDAKGCAYVTGDTSCTETGGFPVTTGPDLSANGSREAFVAKVRADGTGLLYCGFIGGSGSDCGEGIAVDKSGNAWVCGFTDSSESTFPVSGGPDLTANGGLDAFIARVGAGGAGLDSCGFIGGSGHDYGNGIALDALGAVYLAGITGSDQGSFPVLVGPDLTYNGGTSDAFVAAFGSSQPGLALVSPDGGEIWSLGSVRPVTWQARNVTEPLRLVLFDGGVKVGQVASGLAAASGTYAWNAGSLAGGALAAPGTNYRLRLVTSSGTLSDFSDAPFTLAGLRLTSPNGGESWAIGSARTVTWKAAGITGNVRLVLYRGGTKLGTIASGIAASAGSYSWTAGSYSGGTAVPGGDYRIKIAASDNSAGDVSDATFSLSGG